MDAETSRSPYTGQTLERYDTSTDADVERAVAAAAAAAGALDATSPARLAAWLDALAAAVQAETSAMAQLADAETGLGLARLTGEVERAANQLCFYASVARDGAHLAATLDSAPVAIGRVNRPVGPVAVFGASNFPLAFGVLGHDTGSALAAGNPVVAKGHPAHPGLSRRLCAIAVRALAEAGAPDGIFGMVTGFEAGTRLVAHPAIRAVGFTGSQRGGLALWRIANERDDVIPVYAEMGTVNAVVVTAGADPATVATGFVESFTLGAGQFCTKPGLLLVPAGSPIPRAVAETVGARPAGRQLTETIAADFRSGVDRLLAAGATVLGRGQAGDGAGWCSSATVLSAPVSALAAGSPLLEEVFGPVAVIAEYSDASELSSVVDRLPGALAAGIHAGPGDDVTDLVTRLSRKVGRVLFNGWPTGVATTWAQQHGGPWPATTVPTATSVGAAALQRFLRPVAFQELPDGALPAPLRAANPWQLPRRVDGAWQPARDRAGQEPTASSGAR